ncbi:MAG: APC family permease [Deltaproteobacteria bacterium]|nr:MAG: APC family permease [Deltaproteobacteria bacterium]
MPQEASNPPTVKATLGLTGATVNAMALIAPGAFLWITYQLQAAATAPDGSSVAADIWAGIVFALVLAFLTAVSYAELARIYPEAGFGSCYYFAEKAFIDRENQRHHRWARLAKIVTGWAAHLFYWVYPGVMVAFMATLVGYVYNQLTGGTLSITSMVIFSALFSALTGYIAFRGVTGSTFTALMINVIQLATLVLFSGLAIYYRLGNPDHATQWGFSGALDVIWPHSLQGVLIQSTLAILILVGFESCTALAAETKDPKRNIPRAVILSLVIQGLFAYLLEYFAAGFMVSEKLVATDATGATVTGMAAAGASSAPIGDMAILVGNSLLGGIGFGLMISIAVTVGLAILGTTLSCMNTAVRVSYAMAQDQEMPELLNAMHGRFATPHRAIWVLVVVSALIAAIGVQSVVGLTGIALASNFGTFVLYGLTCFWAMIAFPGRAEFSVVKHVVVPALGLLANIAMLVSILYLYIIGNADAQHEAYICFALAGGWAVLSIIYVAVSSIRTGRALIAAPRRAV